MIRAWIGHLGSYNGGYLIGDWVSLPKDEDEMTGIFSKLMNEAAKVGEYGDEFEVMDFETDIDGIYSELSRLGLNGLNDLAEQFESMSEWKIKHFAAVIQAVDSIQEAIDQLDEAIVLDDVDNEAELGEALHREGMLHLEIPEELENFIDWEAFGRNYTTGGDWTLVQSGQAVSLPR